MLVVWWGGCHSQSVTECESVESEAGGGSTAGGGEAGGGSLG